MDSQEFFEQFPEPTMPWPITRDSLLTDSVVKNRPNIAILQYFETLASSLVIYRASNRPEPGVRAILDRIIQQETIPVATLELLLSLALDPDYLYEFDDERLIPACVRLLEKYCSGNRVSQWRFMMLQSSDNDGM